MLVCLFHEFLSVVLLVLTLSLNTGGSGHGIGRVFVGAASTSVRGFLAGGSAASSSRFAGSIATG